ncbi:DsbA family protein [Bacillus salacetis]|uniref:DsbA family protein n=1 Tax=Bacillus salacetis TaxID=2315464 RepID=A0A3A1R5C8_9BACI|nr:DsbA family protein [Bacillus salacetis]RIW38359.1 DsbA family protein [Bacillus salacetis]
MSKKKSSPMKYLVIITLVVVVLLVSIALLTNKSKNTDETLDSHPATENQPTIGENDAPVSVVEFGDFKCPACKAWGAEIYPKLKSDFIDTGKANFSYINTLFHGEESTLSALAAESVYENDPGSYFAFHKELFNQQPNANHDTSWITIEKLMEVAGATTDMDVEQLKQDIEQGSGIEAVEADKSLVEEFNIQQTPTIIINGTKLEDPYDYDRIKELIEEGQ